MKKRIILFVLLLAVCLSGCSLNFKDPETLIRPPQPGGELAGVQEALQEKVEKSSMILKNPKSGDYRSAYTTFDLNEDGVNEAIVFYKQNTDTGTLHMNVLDKNDGKWKSVADFDNIGSDIIEVKFCRLNKSSGQIMVVKCDALEAKQGNISLFRYSNGEVERLLSEPYTEMGMFDMLRDGYPELLLLNLDVNNKTSKARLIKMSDESTQLDCVGEAVLDGNVTGYASIKMDKKNTVYIDSYYGQNVMITELLQWKKGRLAAPLMNLKEGTTSEKTMRSIIVTSQDINGDGIIEIPVNGVLPGKNVNEKETINLTTWQRYIAGDDGVTPDEFFPVVTGVINFADSYMFVYPEDWLGNVTVSVDNEQRLWTFQLWNRLTNLPDRKLMSIQSLTKLQWEKNPIEHCLVSYENGNTVYAVTVHDFYSSYSVTLNDIEKNFIIIN